MGCVTCESVCPELFSRSENMLKSMLKSIEIRQSASCCTEHGASRAGLSRSAGTPSTCSPVCTGVAGTAAPLAAASRYSLSLQPEERDRADEGSMPRWAERGSLIRACSAVHQSTRRRRGCSLSFPEDHRPRCHTRDERDDQTPTSSAGVFVLLRRTELPASSLKSVR